MEFFVFNCLIWPYLNATKPKQNWFDFKSSYTTFLIPATLDWLDRILLTIGMSQTSASMPTMIRGLVPPIAGYFSYLMFDTKFSGSKIMAMVVSITGISLGCFVQLYYETQDGKFAATGYGIMVLLMSAFT
jgi:drug/metabolite transporter (DMT)-like permease